MKLSRRRMHPAAVVAESDLVAGAGVAVVMTIRATHASRASRAGRNSPYRSVNVIKLKGGWFAGGNCRNFSSALLLKMGSAPAATPKYIIGDVECQDEADRVLPNARKNTRASKNSATKPN